MALNFEISVTGKKFKYLKAKPWNDWIFVDSYSVLLGHLSGET